MEEKPLIRIFYDLETTGVNYRRHCIHQLAGLVEVGGEVVQEFDIRLRPHPKAKIEPEALSVSGVTLEELQSYPAWEEGYREFIKILSPLCDRYDKHDKLWLAGYNIRRFDDFFLRKFFELNNDMYFGSWFWPETFDLMVLAGYALQHERRSMENFKLNTVCRTVGIEFDDDKAHDALYDVKKTRELYCALEGVYM